MLDQKSNQGPPLWEHGVLATGPPRKFHIVIFLIVKILRQLKCPPKCDNMICL